MKKNQYCNNFDSGCRNLADRRDGYCNDCGAKEDRSRRSEAYVEAEYKRQNQKPISPNPFREIEHGEK